MGRGWSYETTAFALGVKSVFYQLWGCCGFAAAFPGLVIQVSEAQGEKCPRCWMHSRQADPETGLCPRCAAVVSKLPHLE